MATPPSHPPAAASEGAAHIEITAISWEAAAALAWRFGGSLIRRNGVWHVRAAGGAA